MIRRRYCASLLIAASLVVSVAAGSLPADVRLPSIFGSNMVLQQEHANPVWGHAEAGEQVTVRIADQTWTAKADNEGNWSVKLTPLKAGGPHELVVSGKNTVRFENVLVGEVWVCSGQSNMQWPVSAANDPDLEIRMANYPDIRLITVPQVGTQEPQSDFNGQWQACTPDTVRDFSAVGYFFGRQLHRTLDVPIGLIDNAWGGSAAEAWVRRDLLEADERYQPLLKRWAETERNYNEQKQKIEYEVKLAEWQVKVAAAKLAGRERPRRPRRRGNPLAGQHRPANLYNGVLKPIIGYGIRGAVWYQGETNAGRAYQYRHLFPLMIQQWRDEWQQGDFPFYWVQLADFREEKPEPAESDWAELREAQTMTMSKLPNTGEAVIIDLGEAHDIHPRNKQDVAKRLARWALARDYGIDLVYRSPVYKSMEQKAGRVVLTFDHVGGGLDTFDVRNPIGFTIAGEDRKFVAAEAKIVTPDRIEVWSDNIASPAAVRYAWADNPVCNLQNKEGLPVTPFRTDAWPGVTVNNH